MLMDGASAYSYKKNWSPTSSEKQKSIPDKFIFNVTRKTIRRKGNNIRSLG